MDELSALLLHIVTEQPQRIIALHGLLSGRQTASILFAGLENKQLALFDLLPRLDRAVFESTVHQLADAGDLALDDKLMRRTAAGTQALGADKHHLDRLSFVRADADAIAFGNHFYLAVQVLSEASFNDNRYRPLTADARVQWRVKQWWRESGHEVAASVAELRRLFERLSPASAQALAQRFIAHDYSGDPELQVDPLGLDEILALSELQQAIEQAGDAPHWQGLAGWRRELVSPGALQTASDFNAGQSVEQIAAARNRKLSTITEHLQQAGIFGYHFDPRAFYTVQQEQQLQTAWQAGQHGYQDLLTAAPGLEFLQVRMFQILQLREQIDEHATE